MKLTHNDQEYDIDTDVISLAETILLKKTAGLTLGDILRGVENWDGEAFAALLFLAMRRNKEAVKWQDLMKVNIVEVMWKAAEDIRNQGEEDSSPTESSDTKDLKDGTTPKKSSSRTSSS